jgi:subtilisin family serine protease
MAAMARPSGPCYIVDQRCVRKTDQCLDLREGTFRRHDSTRTAKRTSGGLIRDRTLADGEAKMSTTDWRPAARATTLASSALVALFALATPTAAMDMVPDVTRNIGSGIASQFVRQQQQQQKQNNKDAGKSKDSMELQSVKPETKQEKKQKPGAQSQQQAARSPSGVPPANERRYVPDEVVVEVGTSMTSQQTDALAQRFQLVSLQSFDFPLGGTTLMRLRIADRRSVPVVVRALETDATVLFAQPNYLFALQEDGAPAAAPTEGDPGQYVLQKMHLPQAHELAHGDKVLVAVVDSGVDITHPDLAGDIADSFDAIGIGAPVHFHGTAIAGAIAAHGRLMGAAPTAQILAVRAFSGNAHAEEGTTFAIMRGLDWAVLHGARAVNMSFAGPQDPGMARSLAAAHDKGVVLVAAAGNKGANSPPLYPAADHNVIAVTSTNKNDQLPTFANRGAYVTVAAPGVDLMLLAPDGALQRLSGTSFSAAYVTGTVALMLERTPDLSPDALREALMASAHHLGPKVPDGQSGAGLVDAYQALVTIAPVATGQNLVIPASIGP